MYIYIYSLETIGTLERTASAYIRRITKVFALMGDGMENVYFMGYSRGASVALQAQILNRQCPLDSQPSVCTTRAQHTRPRAQTFNSLCVHRTLVLGH